MHRSDATPTPGPAVPGVVPTRVPPDQVRQARTLLDRDGAVLLTGRENTSDALFAAAAQVLGDRLRELYPHRVRTSREADPVHLHADSFDIVVDIAGVPRRRRDPDEDHVLVQCVRPAPAGAAVRGHLAAARREAVTRSGHSPVNSRRAAAITPPVRRTRHGCAGKARRRK
ncbi:hypothetical protein [Streptomyces qinglanensis]|uniref:hypothetical protein n=1 Tax=Streptomyces qinglanensis TaxID=943816 RepID=UPI00378F8FA9